MDSFVPGPDSNYVALRRQYVYESPQFQSFPSPAGAGAISASSLASGDSNTVSSLVTTSISPASNALVLVAVASKVNSGTATIPTVSGIGGTWVQIATIVDTSLLRRNTLFRDLSSSPGTGKLTIDFAGVSQAEIQYAVDQITGVNVTGTHGSGAVVQSVTGSFTGVSAGETVTLSALASPLNAAYGTCRLNTLSPALSDGSGFTPVTTYRDTTDSTQLSTEYQLNTVSVGFTWSSGSFVSNVIGIEIAATIILPPANPYIYFRPISLRRQTVDDTPQFTEFPFAPAKKLTSAQPNPDVPRYVPIRRQAVDDTPVQGWQPVLTPITREQNPDEPRYVPLRRMPVDDIGQFTAFPGAPAKTPTAKWANPHEYYKPLRSTEGYIVQGWQPVLTPAVYQSNPDIPRYVPIRRTPDDLETGWQPVLTPIIYQSNPDSPRYQPLRRQAADDLPQFTEFPFAPAATLTAKWNNPDEYYKPLKRTDADVIQGWIRPPPTPTTSVQQPWPDDPRYVPLRRTEGYNIQGWQPVLTPVSYQQRPDEPRYVPLRATPTEIALGGQPVLTPALYQSNPNDPRYVPLRATPTEISLGGQPVLTPITLAQPANDAPFYPFRRQPIYDIPQFTEFPFAPSGVLGISFYLPDNPRYQPLKRTDADALMIWQFVPLPPVNPPSIWQPNPNEPRYVALRRQSIDDIGQFTEFPFAPTKPLTTWLPNPNDPRYVPLRTTPDFLQIAWNASYTPSTYWFAPDAPRYQPLRRTPDDLSLGWQPVLTPGIMLPPMPDTQLYFPPRRWIDFNTPTLYQWPSVIPPYIWQPNPNEPRYVTLRRQPVDDLPEFTEFPFAPAKVIVTYQTNPDAPRYVPLRSTEGYISLGGQPVLTPAVYQPNPDELRYIPLKFTKGDIAAGGQPVITPITLEQAPDDPYYSLFSRKRVENPSPSTAQVWTTVLTPITLERNPDDPRYNPRRRTDGYNTQGWQPVLTPAAFSLGPDIPRYLPLRRTEGYTTQGLQPVLTPAWRQIWPDDPRYQSLRRTEGYTTQGLQPVLTPGYWVSAPDLTQLSKLRQIEGQISQAWVIDKVPSFMWWGPDDPRYQGPRRTEGPSGLSLSQIKPPAQTPITLQPNPDIQRYVPIRRTEGYWATGYVLPGLTPAYSWFRPDELRYVPLRRTPDDLQQGWQPVITPGYWVQAPDDSKYRRLLIPHWLLADTLDQPYTLLPPAPPTPMPPRMYRFPYPLGSVLRAGIASLARGGGGG